MKTSRAAMSYAPRISTLCLVAISIALAAYVVLSLRNELAAIRRELAGARMERDVARKNEEVARAQLVPLQDNVARLIAEHDATGNGSLGTAGLGEGGTAAAPPKDDQLPGGVAQTFAAPEMRQMVRMEALTKAKKGFKDLLKQWNLPPADAEQFLQFVADRDSADSSDALAMLATGKLDEKSIAEQEQRQAKAKEESNARLKSLLGDERYAQFEAANARREQLQAVSSYRDHLEAAGAPLTNEQRDALAKIVITEKPDENDWHQEDVEFFTQGMTDSQLAKIRQRQEAAQARIAQQSADFLSPDQVNALQAAFRAELEEQDLALKLARTLFQGGAGAPVAR
jgi:hypothetical protein